MTAQSLTRGTDLDFVLTRLRDVDPTADPEHDPADLTDEDRAVARALRYVRDEILRRRAVQTGVVGDYCGVEDPPACGPTLGLPDCRAHATCRTCGHDAKTGGMWWYRDHRDGRCPESVTSAVAETTR